MNIMKKCLVVPGPFLPYNDTITQLVYKQLRLLPFTYDVCALSNETDEKLQQQLLQDENFKKFHIHYTDKYNNVLFSIKNIHIFKGLAHMKRYIETAIQMYDNHDFLYTSSWPCYTTRVGVALKKEHPNLKWIANFSDPINHSPYKFDEATYRAYSLPEKIAFKLYCKYYVVDEDEANAFEQADLLVFICEEQRDFMIEQYRCYFGKLSKKELEAKSVIVPLNYIPEWNNLIPTSQPNNPIFTLSHFGRVYGLRIIEEFIYALQLFVQKHPDVPFRIEQYGEFRKSDLKLIHKCGLDSYFKIYPKVPYATCIQKMHESDAVLLFDTILPERQIQPYLPSKIMEYSLLQKDVLAITTTKSPSYRILKQSNAIACAYDRKEIEIGLERILINHVSSKVDYAYTNEEAIQGLLEKIQNIG